MVACTVEYRAMKLKGSWSTTEGHLMDVHSTFKCIEKEVSLNLIIIDHVLIYPGY